MIESVLSDPPRPLVTGDHGTAAVDMSVTGSPAKYISNGIWCVRAHLMRDRVKGFDDLGPLERLRKRAGREARSMSIEWDFAEKIGVATPVWVTHFIYDVGGTVGTCRLLTSASGRRYTFVDERIAQWWALTPFDLGWLSEDGFIVSFRRQDHHHDPEHSTSLRYQQPTAIEPDMFCGATKADPWSKRVPMLGGVARACARDYASTEAAIEDEDAWQAAQAAEHAEEESSP
jgi:hypothetical protein